MWGLIIVLGVVSVVSLIAWICWINSKASKRETYLMRKTLKMDEAKFQKDMVEFDASYDEWNSNLVKIKKINEYELCKHSLTGLFIIYQNGIRIYKTQWEDDVREEFKRLTEKGENK